MQIYLFVVPAKLWRRAIALEVYAATYAVACRRAHAHLSARHPKSWALDLDQFEDRCYAGVDIVCYERVDVTCLGPE